MLQQIINELVSLLISDIGAQPTTFLSFNVPNPMPVLGEIKSLNENNIPVPKMRKGCVIGWDKPSELPSQTIPLGILDLKTHKYGGPTSSNPLSDEFISIDSIGHIYTKYGGIIDIAHVRDHADVCRYIATQIVRKFGTGGDIDLGDDTDPWRISTGQRLIRISGQGKDPSVYQAAVLGALISYRVAIWHEIATNDNWQHYSTFSPEDNYSNLLGAYLGFKACIDKLADYNTSITLSLYRLLNSHLNATTKDVTLKAVEFSKDYWYRYGERIYDTPNLVPHFPPNKKLKVFLFLIRRHCETGFNVNAGIGIPPLKVIPWFITDINKSLPPELSTALGPFPIPNRVSVNIPSVDENGISLDTFFKFEIRNAANVDMSLFDGLLNNNNLDSKDFGIIAERMKSRFISDNPNADKPN